MDIAEKIKNTGRIREWCRKEIGNLLDIGYSSYNKIENDNRKISVRELQRLGEFYNFTVDQVINLNDVLPKEVLLMTNRHRNSYD